MVKFSSAEETGFRRLLAELVRWEGLAKSAPRHQSATVTGDAPHGKAPADAVVDGGLMPCHYVPLRKNPCFVGRQDTLGRLKDLLFVQRSPAVALVGLGGVGKAQVALNLAYWAKENKPDHSIFWVPALNHATFEQAYVEMARRLPIQKKSDDDGPKELVRQYLSSGAAGPWLLIVDNADDIDLVFARSGQQGGISEHLPESDDGLILFITRSRDVALSVAGNNVIDLHEMSAQEGTSLLERSLIRKDLVNNDAAVTELLYELTYLPLAIIQAAAYLNRKLVSITDYLKLLRGVAKDIISLLSRGFIDRNRYEGLQNAVTTT